MTLINYFVKATQQIIVYDPANIRPQRIGSGCLIRYRDRIFLITAAHVTDKEGLHTAIETGQKPINNMTPLYMVGALNYIDSYRVNKLDELKSITDISELLKEKAETLDFAFVEIRETIGLFQKELDFGIYGKVTAGEKIILDKIDFEITPDPKLGYSFYGTINPEINGYYFLRQPKLVLGIQYLKTDGRYHVFNLSEPPTDASEFEGTSGAPIFDDEGRFVGIVSHGYEGEPYLFAFSSVEIKKHLDIFIAQEEQSQTHSGK